MILPVKGAGASAKKAPPSPAKKTPSKSPKKNDTYDVQMIVDRKSLNGQTHYLVKWQVAMPPRHHCSVLRPFILPSLPPSLLSSLPSSFPRSIY